MMLYQGVGLYKNKPLLFIFLPCCLQENGHFIIIITPNLAALCLFFCDTLKMSLGPPCIYNLPLEAVKPFLTICVFLLSWGEAA